ncbi:MAG TPA: hypothetical protein VH724_02170 [Candidatus Angelobacter sp.]|nr:hypothetical protein [Candidatus Angelobacter sp.]
MNARRLWALAICLALAHPLAWGDELKPIRDLGKKALNSFHDRHDDDGRRYFEQFLQRVKSSPAAVQDPQIELMLGILGCAMPEHRDLGKAALKRFLQRSKDVGQNRASIENLLQACSSATAVELPAAASLDQVIASASSGAPGVSGTSKGGDPSMKPVAGVVVSAIDAVEMDKRLE